MEMSRHIEVLAERSRALLDSAGTGLDRQVPSCPGWEVADLVAHIGTTWGWSAETVNTLARGSVPVPPDARDETLLAWAAEQARRIVDALTQADPDATCWTFGLPRSPRFWARRQALETTLHAWDVEHALGSPTPMDPTVASDGVDEFLTVLLPRWLKLHPEGWDGETFHLHRTEGDGEWLVRLGPDGEVDAQRTHAKGDIALRGPAESLWLWCAGRQPAGGDASDVEVLGESSLADRWVASIRF